MKKRITERAHITGIILMAGANIDVRTGNHKGAILALQRINHTDRNIFTGKKLYVKLLRLRHPIPAFLKIELYHIIPELKSKV